MKKIIIIIFCIFSSCITAFAFQNTPGGWYNGGWGNGGWLNGGWYYNISSSNSTYMLDDSSDIMDDDSGNPMTG